MNYYNEIDPFCVAWLRQLIVDGAIPPGDVDDRPIQEVEPKDVSGYTQCHFFAGIGGWAYAAELAGWPHGRPLWTGSCPCQPWSRSGRQLKTADERHLGPYFCELIRASRPPVVMGEQVSGAAGEEWFDSMAVELEPAGYTARAVDIPACAVGADHVRPRLYWVADTVREGLEGSQPERSRLRFVSRQAPAKRGYPSLFARLFKRPDPVSIQRLDGVSRPVDCIHAFGNAIVPQLGAEVMMAYMEGMA